jgi:hypothetical protein
MSSPVADERKAEKRARKKFRHEIEKRMLRVATRRVGMCSTTRQLHAYARTLTDRYMHLVDHAPAQVKSIDEVQAGTRPLTENGENAASVAEDTAVSCAT